MPMGAREVADTRACTALPMNTSGTRQEHVMKRGRHARLHSSTCVCVCVWIVCVCVCVCVCG
jgi:t-SNARE complex subunit (syntaxin)